MRAVFYVVSVCTWVTSLALLACEYWTSPYAYLLSLLLFYCVLHFMKDD